MTRLIERVKFLSEHVSVTIIAFYLTTAIMIVAETYSGTSLTPLINGESFIKSIQGKKLDDVYF